MLSPDGMGDYQQNTKGSAERSSNDQTTTTGVRTFSSVAVLAWRDEAGRKAALLGAKPKADGATRRRVVVAAAIFMVN